MGFLDEEKVPLSGPGERTKFKIAIDFGTTYSGIAFALEGCPESLEVIQEWPGGGNNSTQKVPSLISYHGGTPSWGYQVDEMTQECIRGVKLLLDPSNLKSVTFEPAIQSEAVIKKQGKRPVDVVGEYLKKLIDHTKSTLDRRPIGALMNTMDIQYILTVPAVWSDKAKDLTMQAACLAGIPRSNLVLLSEPEAAAVYTIREIQPNSIVAGDSFIVCDAGGGTVDLITYKITQTEPVRIEEVTEGTGAICGSTLLDSGFQNLLINTIGRGTYNKMSKEGKRIAAHKWEKEIKPRYTGRDNSDDFLDAGYFVPLPGVADYAKKHINQGLFYLESEQVEKIFHPVVEKIKTLVSDQERGARKAGYSPKAIILVGGLGSSGYVCKVLKAHFPSMIVMQPRDAWSAVVRGAVYRGLEGNSVVGRKARCHYGVKYQTKFDPLIHSYFDRKWCPLDEEWKASNQMQWYIQKGETISENKPIALPFRRKVKVGRSLVFTDKLRVSFNLEAPKTCSKIVSCIDSGVTTTCELTADLSKIPRELFARRVNSRGTQYFVIPFELILTPLSALMLFELKFNGLSYGSVRAAYC